VSSVYVIKGHKKSALDTGMRPDHGKPEAKRSLGKEVSFHVTDINFFVLQYFIYNLIHEKWQLKRKI